MKPGVIRFRGYPIEQVIGNISFPQMIWLMLLGDLPSPEQGALLEAALVAAVDHGPQAPSIAIGRMAVTCGLPLNGAMASAINVPDDVHGGAGEQCLELYADIDGRFREGTELAQGGRRQPGCLHRRARQDQPWLRAPLSPDRPPRAAPSGTGRRRTRKGHP